MPSVELYESEAIDKMCSISAKDLYKELYSSPEDAQQCYNELHKSSSIKSYTKKDNIAYLNYVIDFCKKIQAEQSQFGAYKWTAHYKYGEKTPNFGREYVNIFGIQKLERRLRGFLTGKLYTDFDIKSAHPCLLRNLIKEHCPHLSTPVLNRYCKERASILQETSLTKLDFLKYMNKDKCAKNTPDILKLLVQELKPVKEFFWDKHPELQPTDNTKNRNFYPLSSLLNKLLCEAEAGVLNRAIECLEIKNPVRMFDGMMRREDEASKITNAEAIIKLNELTKTEELLWDIKEPESFNFPIIIVQPKPKPRCLIKLTPEEKQMYDRKGHPDSYNNKKLLFEKTHFIVLYPLQYVTITTNPITKEISLQRCSKTEFYGKYENKYYTIEIDEAFEQKPFIPTWFADETRRTYYNLNFVPPPTICPEETYNLYTGMEYQKIEVQPDPNIDVFLNHLRLLSGDDQTDLVYNYQLNYFAHMLQKPGELPGTAILWNSPPGAGKNIWIDNFGKYLVGEKYHLSTANADRFVGRWRDTNNKFIGVYNEATSKDTFGMDGKMKELITEPKLDWEEKNEKAVSMNSYIRLFILTNKDNGIRIDQEDRRFQVVEIMRIIKEKAYFDELGKAWKNPALVLGLAKYLLNVDISNWDPQRDRVNTDYYRAMQSINIPNREKWLATLLDTDEIDDPTYRWKPLELYKSYLKYMDKLQYKGDTNTMFGRKLKNPMWKEAIIPYMSAKTCRYYTINREKLVEILIQRNVITVEELESDEDEVELE